MLNYDPVIHQILIDDFFSVDVLRLDLLHPEISGNKWFKLKYNLQAAVDGGYAGLLTFGGPFSNHIAATAAAGKIFNVKTIGVIRGEEQPGNPTLQAARKNGMELHFADRETYRRKDDASFRDELIMTHGNYYVVPEGGNNQAGISGCAEIIRPGWDYDYVFCACGTGTTFAGILKSISPETVVVGINVLKGANSLVSEVNELLGETDKIVRGNEALDKSELKDHCITDHYAFSGYARFDPELVEFKKNFEAKSGISLDYIYTSKLFYAVENLVHKRKIPSGSKVLVVHSGGRQGNKGFESRFKIPAQELKG